MVVDGRAARRRIPTARSSGRPSWTASRPDMEVAQEEIFGPVLSVIHADSLDEAIDIVNASRYGNGTSIFTESGAAVRRYRHDVEVGMIGVNVGVAAPVAFFPFSGWKGSFFGDLHAHGTRRGRVLHAQEDRHLALVLGRRDRPLLRRAGRALESGVAAGRRPVALLEHREVAERLARRGRRARRPA